MVREYDGGGCIKVGWSAMKHEGQNMCMPKYKNDFDAKTEFYIENRGVTAASEEAATNIVCKSTSLPIEEKMLYRN